MEFLRLIRKCKVRVKSVSEKKTKKTIS